MKQKKLKWYEFFIIAGIGVIILFLIFLWLPFVPEFLTWIFPFLEPALRPIINLGINISWFAY